MHHLWYGALPYRLLRFRNAYVEVEGIRPLQVLLADVVRCPSHPRTTALDAGHPVSGIWKQGDLHDWQPHHTSPSYLSPLPSTLLTLFFLPSRDTREGPGIMSLGVPIPEAAHTHTAVILLCAPPGLLTRAREPAPELEKVTRVHDTSRVHVQGGQGEEEAKTVTSRT